MTTDAFTEAARAEAERLDAQCDLEWRSPVEVYLMAAKWARTHLAAQESTDAEVEAAAQELWKHRALGTIHPNYPWDGLAPELRQSLRELTRAALSAARAARRDEEKR